MYLILKFKIIPIFVFVLWACIIPIQAQTNHSYNDKLKLNNGSTFYGSLIEYNNQSVVLLLKNGQQLSFKQDDIKTINMHQDDETNKFPTSYWYQNVNLSLQGGNNESRNKLRPGYGISYSGGYRFGQYLSLGAGIEWNTYSVGAKEYFVPIFAEVISFLSDTYASPFVKLQAGGSFSHASNDLVIESKGGWFLYPSIGWRLNSAKTLNYTLDIGFKFQKANFLYQSENNWRWNTTTTREQDILFRRISFRFGMLF